MRASGSREGALASERRRGQKGEVEGATGEREERIWRAERARDGREQKRRRGDARIRAGETDTSWQGRAEARGREGGRAGGAGAGAGRGEYNSAAAKCGGSFGRPSLQPVRRGAQHPLRLTPQPAEERVAGARRAELRAAAVERNFSQPFPAAALVEHFSGGSRQPGSVSALSDKRPGVLGR